MPTVAGVLVRGQIADMLWIVQLYWQLHLLVRSVCHLALAHLQVRVLGMPGAGPAWRKEVENIHAQVCGQWQTVALQTVCRLDHCAWPAMGRPVWSCAPIDERSLPQCHDWAGVCGGVGGPAALCQPL